MLTSTIAIINETSNNMNVLESESIDLIVTSPPYPMIEMWDDCFSKQSPSVKTAIDNNDWISAFNEMHTVLNSVWAECDRVLRKNGFLCINIGDATRTCNGEFQLYSNHTKVIDYFLSKNYCLLPDIHWRKQSNAPNKFMGSGMYPSGAYVTYEHEYILIFRKGGKRVFKGSEKENRKESAYFWEERNIWFSDLWDIKGTSQELKKDNTRKRSAAFPFEIPYRLINMYSNYGDTVLDPFAGLSTTALACAATHRNCYCFDTDATLCEFGSSSLLDSLDFIQSVSNNRLTKHLSFIDSLSNDKYEKCYDNVNHGFKVKTRQEKDIKMLFPNRILQDANNTILIEYEDYNI